jgi:hypothetical protein
VIPTETVNTPTETVNSTTETVNTPTETVNTPTEIVNSTPKPVNTQNRVAYNCFLSIEEDWHVSQILEDLIKFNVVENKSDFVRKAIDVYINYNNVCKENKLSQPLIIPVPDGKGGSIDIQPKLLANSLFKSVSTIPQF